MSDVSENTMIDSFTEGRDRVESHKRTKRGEAGKGDVRRGDNELYAENYDRIFRKEDDAV